MFGNGVSSSKSGGVCLSEEAPQVLRMYPQLTQRPGKGICTLWTPHTLCHFTAMKNNYARYA
jgi:hypothetical protein